MKPTRIGYARITTLAFLSATLLIAMVGMPTSAQDQNGAKVYYSEFHVSKGNPAFQHGLWACSMPAPASYLEEDFTDAKGRIEFSYAVLDQFAHERGETEGFCNRVNADDLKIIGFDSFRKLAVVTTRKAEEKELYVGMLSYANYMSFHVVSAN